MLVVVVIMMIIIKRADFNRSYFLVFQSNFMAHESTTKVSDHDKIKHRHSHFGRLSDIQMAT
jgi:hypothetical protein